MEGNVAEQQPVSGSQEVTHLGLASCWLFFRMLRAVFIRSGVRQAELDKNNSYV